MEMRRVDHNEFGELLLGTQYSNFTSSEDVRSRLKPLGEWIKKNIPEKLYRYRVYSDYSLEALKNDEIWGSSIVTFNDPFECLPRYDHKKIHEYIDSEFSSETVSQNLHNITANKTPQKVLEAYPDGFADDYISGNKKIPDMELLADMLVVIKDWFEKSWEHNREELDGIFYDGIAESAGKYRIACFSETNSSVLMWSHYARSHTGFCVEYNIKSVRGDCAETCADICSCPGFMLNHHIAPVIYSEERYDASLSFMSMLLNRITEKYCVPVGEIHHDMLSTIKTMLVKSKNWEYEKEWRLISNPAEGEYAEHGVITKMKPSAVFVGAKMKPKETRALAEICNEKRIPLYKMGIQFYSTRFECTLL